MVSVLLVAFSQYTEIPTRDFALQTDELLLAMEEEFVHKIRLDLYQQLLMS